MNKTFRTAVAALTLTLGASLLIGSNEPASAAYSRPNAKNDKASFVAGGYTLVKPLTNDKVWKKSKARIKVTSKAPGLVVMKKGKGVGIASLDNLAAGQYRLTYRVTDKRGRYDDATIKVTVTRAVVPTQNPTPTPQPTPTPTPQPTPAPDSLVAVINSLPVATEVRTGYDRNTWKHWNNGLYADGCDTRAEVLRSEAVVAPAAGTACPYTTTRNGGGSWFSYYDGVTTSDPSSFDIDHMVPLAEAHDSGAYAWTAAQKETYANDQGDPRSLVAVTANSNRSKSDQDPGEWWPLLERCRYAAEWTATKARFGLSVDTVEKDALLLQASQCGDLTVTYTKAW